jgi:hypothetical protein
MSSLSSKRWKNLVHLLIYNHFLDDKRRKGGESNINPTRPILREKEEKVKENNKTVGIPDKVLLPIIGRWRIII